MVYRKYFFFFLNLVLPLIQCNCILSIPYLHVWINKCFHCHCQSQNRIDLSQTVRGPIRTRRSRRPSLTSPFWKRCCFSSFYIRFRNYVCRYLIFILAHRCKHCRNWLLARSQVKSKNWLEKLLCGHFAVMLVPIGYLATGKEYWKNINN